MYAVVDDRDEMEGQEPASSAERTCAGCRAVVAREELARLTWIEDETIGLVPDFAGKLGGRGVWVHPQRACVHKAARGGFSRALKREARVDAGALLSIMVGQLERSIDGLMVAALRRHQVALGTDAVQEALRAGAVRLLLVAKDAAGRREELIEQARGRQVPTAELFDKQKLGRLSGRETLGVLGLLDPQIAREIATKARWLAGLSEDG